MRLVRAKQFERIPFKPSFSEKALQLNIPYVPFDIFIDQGCVYFYFRGEWSRAWLDLAETKR